MGKLTIVGVGIWDGQLTREAEKALMGGARVILHTDRCPCAEWLKTRGIAFESLDALYESLEDFDEHTRAAAQRVLEAARSEDVVYAVLDIRDRSVVEILRQAKARVIPGPPTEGELLAQAEGATLCLEASDWENFELHAVENALIRELDSRALASEVKLKLMECYPEEEDIFIRQPDGSLARTKLYNLDRMKSYDHRTAALIPACSELTDLGRFNFDDLIRLVRRLHGPDGCPWDRAQTHQTLRGDLIEEAYEAADAIDQNDDEALMEELGDILSVVALHAEIARDHGAFEIMDIVSGIAQKMIRRHPHVFSGESGLNDSELSERWQEIKRQEHRYSGRAESMRAVARALPALTRAQKVLRRTEDESTLRHIADSETPVGEKDGEHPGAALLALVARMSLMGADAEDALQAATDDFIRSYAETEQIKG